ncbi:MAG: hypothetical protein LBV18_07120 [Alistipes sp.]|jgi:hypothetical protein|nr:hypothetical protein [Alistipes sp.]
MRNLYLLPTIGIALTLALYSCKNDPENTPPPADEPSLEVNETTLAFGKDGGSKVVEITSNVEWEIEIDGEWLAADEVTGTGDGEVTLTASALWEDGDRSATVTVKTEGIEREIAVTQAHPEFVGMWLLSESGAVKGGADLAYYDAVSGEMKPQYYSEQNGGESLGTVGNFMGLYGSKLYVVLSGDATGSSSSVKVVDSRTGKLIRSIDMKGPDNGTDVARQLAFHGGKVYVTTYFGGRTQDDATRGGVARIDTVSLAVEAYAPVGYRPEGVACHNGKLFVTNNGTRDYEEHGDVTLGAGVGNTVSIVDIATFAEERTVTVPTNPGYIQAAADGYVYFSSQEVYPTANTPGVEAAPSALHRLDPETDEVTTFEGVSTGFGRFAMAGKYIYTGTTNYSTFADEVFRVDTTTGEATKMEVDFGENVMMLMLYGIGVNPLNGDIYLGGMGEDVVFIKENGEYIADYQVTAPFVTTFVPVFE